MKHKLILLGLPLFAIVLFFVVLLILFRDHPVESVRISDLTDTSVTISWTTVNEQLAAVEYYQEGSNEVMTAFDTRDLVKNSSGQYELSEQGRATRNIHYVVIRNLNPDTTYTFSIKNAGNFNEQTIKTYPTLASVNSPMPIYGKVVNFMADSPNPNDGVIFYRIHNKADDSPLTNYYSSLISADSTWSGDLSNLRDNSGAVLKVNEETHILDVEVTSDTGKGWQQLNLIERLPAEDILVNIRYITDETN